MNEKIYQFCRQAQAYTETHYQPGTYSADEWVRTFSEKFAELLIQECMNVAVNKDAGIAYTADVAGYVAAGRSNAARAIKQHFEGI